MCWCPCNSENAINSLYYYFESVQEVCSILLHQKNYGAENLYCTQGLARCKSSRAPRGRSCRWSRVADSQYLYSICVALCGMLFPRSTLSIAICIALSVCKV